VGRFHKSDRVSAQYQDLSGNSEEIVVDVEVQHADDARIGTSYRAAQASPVMRQFLVT
jgi:hypothetical protein